MKTLLQVLVLTLVSSVVFAQQNKIDAKLPASTPKAPAGLVPYNPVSPLKEYIKQETGKRGAPRWMNYALDYAEVLSEGPFYSFLPLFPDSNIIAGISNDTVFIPHYHGAASVIHPSRFITHPWNDTRFTVDSVMYQYAYFRKTDDTIVDTMIISIFKPKYDFWGIIGHDTLFWKAVGYNYLTNQLSRNINDTTFEIKRYKLLLTNRDTSTQSPLGVTIKTARVAIENPIEQDMDSYMGAFVQFIPGYEYSYGNGSTLTDDYNTFYLYSSEANGLRQEPVFNDKGNYNYSYVLTTETRHNDTTSGFINQLFPCVGYENRFEYENHMIYFHLYDPDGTGINDLSVTNGLTFYPNPAKENAFLSYNLKTTVKSVSFVVYDLTGKELLRTDAGAKQAGSYTLPVNTQKLPAGMYLYSLKIDGETANGKFIVD